MTAGYTGGCWLFSLKGYPAAGSTVSITCDEAFFLLSLRKKKIQPFCRLSFRCHDIRAKRAGGFTGLSLAIHSRKTQINGPARRLMKTEI